jgi:hypothetical protein
MVGGAVLAGLSTGCEVLAFAAVENTGYQHIACNDLDVLELSKSLIGFRPDEGSLEPSEPLARKRS